MIGKMIIIIIRLNQGNENDAGEEKMNDRTKHQIMKNREVLKGYSCADIGAEDTDQKQKISGPAPVLFVWSAIPYRCEWRYGLKAAKYILLDAGHVCENLYLAAENIGLGVCAVGAYDQELLDELLGFMPGPSADPEYECAVYVAAAGKSTW